MAMDDVPKSTIGPGVRRHRDDDYSSTRRATATRSSQVATPAYPDRPCITWTPDQLAKGIFYHARELDGPVHFRSHLIRPDLAGPAVQ